MNFCDEARKSLEALKSFVHQHQENAAQRLDELAKRRGFSFDVEESAANTKVVLDREERFLRVASDALNLCTKKSLEDLLMEMRGLSHYFCVYLGDRSQLTELTNDLYLNIHYALNNLPREDDSN